MILLLEFKLNAALQTANFQRNAQKELDQLKKLQPNMPLMVTEFWSGWFDHWIDNRHGGLKFSGKKKNLGLRPDWD